MCIACEMNFWAMLDALPDDVRERILREQAEAARFACDAAPPAPQPPAVEDERKP